MYKLTLTADERSAIDWIGHRYAHGNDLFDLLVKCDRTPDQDWDSKEDLTFTMPEHIAWKVNDIIQSEDNLACFADEFRHKLYLFSDQIV